MDIRALAREEVALIRRIDRTEAVEGVYAVKDGHLVLETKRFVISDEWWQRERVEGSILPRLEALLDEGGFVYGAFEGAEFAGIAALDARLRGRRALLEAVFVSKPYRGRGIARALVDAVKAQARRIGADQLYVSSIPTEHTVRFYQSCGFKVAERVEPDLFKEEPEDIHMTADL